MKKLIIWAMIALTPTFVFAEDTKPQGSILDPLHRLSDAIPGKDTLNMGVSATITEYDSIEPMERISGHISVNTEFETDDKRDYVGTSIGVRADVVKGGHIIDEDKQEIVTPFIGIAAGTVRERHEAHAKAGADKESAGIGIKLVYDLVENKSSGISIAAAANIHEGGIEVGPGLELVGSRYGVMAYPTDILIVERAGENGIYRNRYSLNPIIIAFNALAGKRTSLHVLSEIIRDFLTNFGANVTGSGTVRKAEDNPFAEMLKNDQFTEVQPIEDNQFVDSQPATPIKYPELDQNPFAEMLYKTQPNYFENLHK